MTTPRTLVKSGRRLKALASLCLVLTVIVTLRQLGAGQETQPRAEKPAFVEELAQAFDVADFAWPPDAFPAPGAWVERDPFQRGSGLAALNDLPVASAAVPAPNEATGATPGAPSGPSERERAQAALDALRLTGLAVRQGQVFALLLQGERFHTVAMGDRVDQRFEVTALDGHAIELLDPISGARRRIHAPGP